MSPSNSGNNKASTTLALSPTAAHQHPTTETYLRSTASPPLSFKPTLADKRSEKQQVPTVFHTLVAYIGINNIRQHWPDRPTCSDTTNVTPQIYPSNINKIRVRKFNIHGMSHFLHIKTTHINHIYTDT